MTRGILSSKLTRYIFVGGTSYVLEICLLALLLKAGMPPLISVSIAFWTGFVVAFTLQKLIAFKNHKKQPSVLIRQTILYTILVLFNYAFTLLFISSIGVVLGLLAARTIALVLTTCWNFVIYNTFIFRNNSNDS